jgi:hypothetical protein
VTVDPVAPAGTLNVQVNTPVAFVAREPLAQVVTVIPPSTNPTVLDTENPVPDTTTVAPTGPCPGATVIAGIVSVNDWGVVWVSEPQSSPTRL